MQNGAEGIKLLWDKKKEQGKDKQKISEWMRFHGGVCVLGMHDGIHCIPYKAKHLQGYESYLRFS